MLGVGIGINRRPLGAANYAKQLAKAYEARVIADGGVVESLGCFTAFAEALGAYQPPIALAATGIGETSFTANWKPFKDAKYYLLDVSTSPTFSTFVYENEIVPAPTTSYVVIGLNSNTTYYYRVRASTTFDADYQAVLDYATTQGYTLPSAGQQLLQNQLVLDLKDAGIWSKLDTFGVFATDGGSDFALIDWKRLSQYTAVNSPTFTANQGFTGDGTSAYIDTNFNLLNDSVNYTDIDASRYYMHYFGAQIIVDGIAASSAYNSIRLLNTAGHTINSASSLPSPFAYTNSQGIKSIHRINLNDVSLFNDKIGSNLTQLGEIPLRNANQLIFRRSSSYSTNQTFGYALGASLVAENDDFVDALTNYLSSL